MGITKRHKEALQTLAIRCSMDDCKRHCSIQEGDIDAHCSGATPARLCRARNGAAPDGDNVCLSARKLILARHLVQYC